MKSEKICYKSADGQWAMGIGQIFICSKHLWISYYFESGNKLETFDSNDPKIINGYIKFAKSTGWRTEETWINYDDFSTSPTSPGQFPVTFGKSIVFNTEEGAFFWYVFMKRFKTCRLYS